MIEKIKNFIRIIRTLFASFGIYRSEKGYIAGVCQGMADLFKFNVHIIRLIWIISPFISLGASILIYILFVVIIPKKNINQSKKRVDKSDYIDIKYKEL